MGSMEEESKEEEAEPILSEQSNKSNSSSRRVAKPVMDVEDKLEPEQFLNPPEPNQKEPPVSKQNMQGKFLKEHEQVRESGRWGTLSQKEVIGVCVAVVLILVGAILAIVFGIVLRDDAPRALPIRPPPPTASPSAFPEHDPAQQWAAIVAAIRATAPQADASGILLPETLAALAAADNGDASFYTPEIVDDAAQPAVVRAMAWILNDDPRDVAPDSEWLVTRFALATLYYATAGEGWTNSTNWLTQERVCDWYGIFCNRLRAFVQEIDLNTNNLVGTLPAELALLGPNFLGAVLSQNELMGSPPFTELGNMPRLSFLFLDNNKFTGTISENVRDNGVLTTLMVQRNEFTGTWPRPFCIRDSTQWVHVLQAFAADCQQVNLDRCVCCPEDFRRNNCY